MSARVTHEMRYPSTRSTTLVSFVALEKSIEASYVSSGVDASLGQVLDLIVVVEERAAHRRLETRNRPVQECRNTPALKLLPTEHLSACPTRTQTSESEYRSASPTTG